MFNRHMSKTWIQFLTEPAVIFWGTMAIVLIVASFTDTRKKK